MTQSRHQEELDGDDHTRQDDDLRRHGSLGGSSRFTSRLEPDALPTLEAGQTVTLFGDDLSFDALVLTVDSAAGTATFARTATG